MLVETMTEREKIKYLVGIEEKINSIASRIVMRTCLHKKKGAWESLGTRSIVLNGNRYYYSIKAQRVSTGGRIGFSIECLPYVVLTRDNGRKYILNFDTLRSEKSLKVYELHVFERYRERFLKNTDISLTESIRIFFERNNLGRIIVGKKAKVGYVKIIDDGVLMCDDEVLTLKTNTRHWKTFITEEMLFEDQSHLSKYGIFWEEFSSLLKSWNEDRHTGTKRLNQSLDHGIAFLREDLEREDN